MSGAKRVARRWIEELVGRGLSIGVALSLSQTWLAYVFTSSVPDVGRSRLRLLGAQVVPLLELLLEQLVLLLR